MGKSNKRGQRRSGAGDDTDSMSTFSTGTALTADQADFDSEFVEVNSFDTHVDALYEKRATTREKALESLVGLMTNNVCYDEVETRIETLSRLFNLSMKKGGALESTLAARALCLLILTLNAGSESERLLREALPTLERQAQHGKNAAAKESAIDALAMMAFIAAEEPEDINAVLQLLHKSFKSASEKVVAAAIRGWMLIVTTFSMQQMTAEFVCPVLTDLLDLLHASDVDVRAAAGQCITYLYKQCGMSDMEASGFESDAMSEDSISTVGTIDMSGLEEMKDRMKDLAKNRGDKQRRNRRERTVLRQAFKGFCNIVEDGGDVKAVKIKLRHGDVLVIDTQEGMIRLAAFKRVLSTGFQSHLLNNELLHAVFNFQPTSEAPDKMSRGEKRMYRSPNSAESKERDQVRRHNRSAVAAYKSNMVFGC